MGNGPTMKVDVRISAYLGYQFFQGHLTWELGELPSEIADTDRVSTFDVDGRFKTWSMGSEVDDVKEVPCRF
jgi:hypothetical protein